MLSSLRTGFLFLTLGVAVGGSAQTDITTGPVMISSAIPANATRITVPLTASTTQDQYSGGLQSRQLSSEPVPPALQEIADRNNFRQYMNLGTDPAGRIYHLLTRVAEDLNFISSQGSRSAPFQVLVLRQAEADSSDYEPVTSGLLSMGNQAEVPFRYTLPHPIGTSELREINGVLSFTIHGSSGNQLSGNATSRSGLSASGSTFLTNSKLNVTLNPVANIPPAPDQQVRLNLEPHSPNIPARSATGKASDLLTLGPVKVAVESIASDLSQITLAVVHGDLGKAESEQAQAVTSLPAVSQVELFDRRIMSSDDLLSASARSGWLVLVFGEFKSEGQPGYYHPSQERSSALTLPARAIQGILGQETATPPTLGFVVRSLDLRSLYSEHLNSRPDYLVLSDYADPTQVQFRMPNPYGGPSHFPGSGAQTPATFRQILNLPDNRVSVAVFDSTGATRYLKADVGDNLQSALLEAVAAMRQGGATGARAGAGTPPPAGTQTPPEVQPTAAGQETPPDSAVSPQPRRGRSRR